MEIEHRYIEHPNVFAIYIKSLKLLIITTNLDGQHGIIVII